MVTEDEESCPCEVVPAAGRVVNVYRVSSTSRFGNFDRSKHGARFGLLVRNDGTCSTNLLRVQSNRKIEICHSRCLQMINKII